MSGVSAMGWGLTAALGVMAIAYACARRTRNLGWVDVGWSLGIGVVALLHAAVAEGFAGRRLLVAGMAAAWALRLSWHVGVHRVWRRPEDARYDRLRRHWGAQTERRAPLLFAAEAILVVVFSIPLWVAMTHPRPDFGLWDVIGLLVWAVAVLGETSADRQLERFRTAAGNRGRTCRAGWWKYSRHPNYFFEWLHWWSYAAIAVGAPGGWWALLGPALMLLFLFRLTGIPHTERQALARRGEDYRRYQQSTSIFVPWFPKPETRP